MHAVWQVGAERVEVREVAMPSPGPGEVLVRLAVSALCGSELEGYRRERQGANGGHEAAGVVVAVGAGCSHLRPGDRVGISAVQGCGACAHCAQGHYTYCERHRVLTGLHAEYAVSRELGCHALPADVPWEAGVLLTGDGLGVPYHVSRRLGERTRPGTVVAVFGAGPVGLGNVLVQARLGARVAAVDISPYRLSLARALGATWAVPVQAGGGLEAEGAAALAAAVRAACGCAPDVCLECAGRQPTLFAALEAVRTGGTVVCVGEQGAAPISPSAHLIRRDITLMGSWFTHFSEYPAMLDLYRSGWPVADLVTHRYALDDAPEAFAAFAAGRTGKTLLCPWPAELSGMAGGAPSPGPRAANGAG